MEMSGTVPATPDQVRLRPVDASERIASVDVLRGVAVLSILTINIYAFGLPAAVLKNPPIAGGFTGIDFGTWLATHMIFYHKFITIFSMLFGAGLILLSSRLEQRGVSVRGIYYRRILWLLLFGLCHGYLLWIGDILYFYAICGLLIYLFRRKSARKLLIIGSIVYLVVLPLQHGTGRMFEFMHDTAEKAEIALSEGEAISEAEEGILEGWKQIRKSFVPSREEIDREIEIFRDGYGGIVKERAEALLWMQTVVTLFYFIWRIGGLMLIGMGLMKAGVFSAARSKKFYAVMLVSCYAAGFALVASGVRKLIAHDFDFIYNYKIGSLFNLVGAPLVSLGHISVVMLICKSGALGWLTRRLAAVGRMAFSNYIFDTVVCTTIFYGYGFGLFSRYGRFQLMGFVVAIWIVQLVVSPLWLKRFRFGPLEWLWRTLAYGKAQPFRISAQ